MMICALLGACIIAFAGQKQKTGQQPKVDFTVNYAVESNYNTTTLRKQLFDKKDTSVMVVAHRGDWHGTAENSLHAIQKAIEKGCAAVEVDVRKTRDDSLVLMADETVDRMTSGKGRVSDMTLAEIRALTLKEYHGNPTPQRVPTLEEALRFCKGKILITVSNYKDYKKEIDALVKKTDTGTEFFQLEKVPRKKAATWKMSIEQQGPHGNMFDTYGGLRAKGVTVFVTDAPKAFNGFLNISHVNASKSMSSVYGDGQKVDYIMVRYDHEIDGATVSKNTYQVENHEVADAFTSSNETPDGRADKGNNVIIMLKNTLYLDATNATTAKSTDKTETRDEQQHAIPTITAGSKPGRKDNPYPTTVVFRQTEPIKTTDGKTYTERLLLRNTMASTLVVDDFKQKVYRDSISGDTLRYNIFVPADNSGSEKKYPLVVFLHDASCAGQEDTYTLRQGLGAVVWATPEEQAKRPCIVVAPQFDEVVVDDDYHQTAAAETTADLIRDILSRYPVDTARVYITGQSMGCMMTYLLMSKHPSLFTAGYLVAGHWRASDLAPMSEKPLWLVSSAGKSKEGAEEAIAEWQQHGGVAATAEWPLTATDEERDAETAELLSQGGNIHYSHLTTGSHFDTWRVAYGFRAIRDWLFQQHK